MNIQIRRTNDKIGLAGYLYEAFVTIDGIEFNEFGDTQAEAKKELCGEIWENYMKGIIRLNIFQVRGLKRALGVRGGK